MASVKATAWPGTGAAGEKVKALQTARENAQAMFVAGKGIEASEMTEMSKVSEVKEVSHMMASLPRFSFPRAKLRGVGYQGVGDTPPN